MVDARCCRRLVVGESERTKQTKDVRRVRVKRGLGGVFIMIYGPFPGGAC